jgi:hypothetical protein
MTPLSRRVLSRLLFPIVVALALVPAVRMTAQSPAGKKVLTLADYGPWKRITSPAISNDGKWVTYTCAPNDGDETLFVKQLDGDTLHTIAIGGPAGGAGGRGGAGGGGAGVQFSDDSRWIAYYVNPPSSAGRGRGAAGARGATPGRGAAAPGGAPPAAAGGAAPAAAPARKLELLDLTSGTKYDVANAGGFQFSKGSEWLAVKINGTPNDTSHRGSDLILRRLATGENQNIGNVNQYDFDDSGKWLAYTVDAANRMGNGVYVANPATGETRTLDNVAMEYDGLVWRTDATSLAALRGEKAKGKEQKDNVLVAWADAGAAPTSKTEWDPAKDASFPKGFVLSELSAPRWSKDGSRLFVGIKEQQDTPADSTDEKANLDIFHWKDTDLQSEQIVRIAQLRRATFAGTLAVASKKFVRLADDTIPTITPTADDKWAVGRDATSYEHDFSEGQPSRGDYYLIDTSIGARTLLVKHVLRTLGTSPDSQWFLYVESQHVMARNLLSGKVVNVDAATGKSFINTDDDHAAEKPVWGVAGWSKDGKVVLLNDKYDVWSMPLDGSKGTPFTAGAGAKDQTVLRLTQLGGGGGRGGRGGGRGGRRRPGRHRSLEAADPDRVW